MYSEAVYLQAVLVTMMNRNLASQSYYYCNCADCKNANVGYLDVHKGQLIATEVCKLVVHRRGQMGNGSQAQVLTK